MATTGKVMGMVIDIASEEPIVGAALTLKGSGLDATSDAEGRYVFLAVPPGMYTLMATVSSHRTEEQPVQVTSDFVITANFDMQKVESKMLGLNSWTFAGGAILFLVLLALLSLRIIKSRKQN